MKTQGLQVVAGYIVDSSAESMVPVQLWSRLKHELVKAGQLEAFTAEYRLERDAFVALGDGRNRHVEARAEQLLFARWVERVVGPQQLWPWQRGWTDELVDDYLRPKPTEVAA